MLWSQKIDVVDMDSKKRWMSAAVSSFFWDTVGQMLVLDWMLGGQRGGKLPNWGAGLKNCSPENGLSKLKTKMARNGSP